MRKNIEISDKKISEFLEQFYGYFESGYAFEEFLKVYLEKIGLDEVVVTQRSSDGGIDLEAVRYGVGGFAGATVRDAMRYGVARGLYSNDAGTGYGIIAHASAKTDHPVRQSSWGWGEVFLDTIVVCSVTAFSIILTNAYIDFPGVDSASLTTMAFKVSYGQLGAWFMAISITVFAWTTIIGMYYSCEKSVNYVFGDTEKNKIATKIYMIYYLFPCIFFYNVKAQSLWAMTDILSAIYILITFIFIITKQKEIMRLFNDFWNRFIPAKERGENVPDVVFGTIEGELE